MPTIKSYTPAWLATSPGANLFKRSPEASYISNTVASGSTRTRARRTIARRGTEAYIAVGREIRWVDLVYLRDTWISNNSRERRSVKREDDLESSLQVIDDDDLQSSVDGAQGYRV